MGLVLLHVVSMPLERLANCSIGLSIPDLNGEVTGSRGDVPAIWRVSNQVHPTSMPLERLANSSTGLRIPDSNGVVARSGYDEPCIQRVSN